MQRYRVKISLVDDWIRFVRKTLESWGYSLPATIDPHELAIKYFNLLHRKVPRRPRTVLFSKEFSCPPMYKKRLLKIKKVIEKGEDITPYLSRNLKKLDYNDFMLNDWGIFHLHLGKKLESDGFVERTELLLYAIFDENHAYLINVMKHGEWANHVLIEIVHRNWPHIIERWKIKGITSSSLDTTAKQRIALRKSGAVSLVQMEDGTVYGPPGGGYAASRISIKAVISTDYVFNTLKRIEIHIKENIADYIKLIERHGKEVREELHFSLKITEQGSFIVEEHSGIFFPIDV